MKKLSFVLLFLINCGVFSVSNAMEESNYLDDFITDVATFEEKVEEKIALLKTQTWDGELLGTNKLVEDLKELWPTFKGEGRPKVVKEGQQRLAKKVSELDVVLRASFKLFFATEFSNKIPEHIIEVTNNGDFDTTEAFKKFDKDIGEQLNKPESKNLGSFIDKKEIEVNELDLNYSVLVSAPDLNPDLKLAEFMFFKYYDKFLPELLSKKAIAKEWEIGLEILINRVNEKIKIMFKIIENDNIIRRTIKNYIFYKTISVKKPTLNAVKDHIEAISSFEKKRSLNFKIQDLLKLHILSIKAPDDQKKLLESAITPYLDETGIKKIEEIFSEKQIIPPETMASILLRKPEGPPVGKDKKTNNRLFLIVGGVVVAAMLVALLHKRGWLAKAKEKFDDVKKWVKQKINRTKDKGLSEEAIVGEDELKEVIQN